MPNFPRQQSKAVPTTQMPSVGAVESTEGKILEQGAKVAQGVQDNAIKLTNAFDTVQKTTATANFKEGMADILQRAQNDPNYNNSDQYIREIEKLRTDNLKGFVSKSAETEAAINFRYESKIGQIQLDNLYKKKMIDVGQASTLRLLDIEAKNPSPDMEARMSAILSQQVQDGIFGYKDAFTLQQKYVKQGKYNAFLRDGNKDGLDAEQMAKAVRYEQSMAKKQEEERKQMQLTTVNDFGEKLANRSLTVEELEGAVTSGLIDAETGAAFELALAGPDQWSDFSEETEQRGRSKLITGLLEKLSPDNVDSRMKIVKSSLQNYNDKKMNSNDLTFILRVANGQSKEPQNKVWGFLKSAVGTLKVMPAPFAAGVVKKFSERWDIKEDPRIVIQQAAIDQYKEDRPETASLKVGDVIKRKSGSYEVSGYNEEGSPVFRKK